MLNKLKKNRIIRSIILPFYTKNFFFKIHKSLKLPFRYKLNNGKSILLHAEGQIAYGIYRKTFERKNLNLFQKSIKPGNIVVDVGANLGLYSLIASKITGNAGKVYSFEPSQTTFELLSRNFSINQIQNMILVDKGLGDIEIDKIVLRQDLGTKDAERYIMPVSTNSIQNLTNVKEIESSEEIEITTLDIYLKSFQIETIDFLKIDTEGFEFYVLQGAKKTLISSKNLMILMECTKLGTARANTSQKKVFEFLNSLGYKIFCLDDQGNNWVSDSRIFNAGDVWACRDSSQLPLLSSVFE